MLVAQARSEGLRLATADEAVRSYPVEVLSGPDVSRSGSYAPRGPDCRQAPSLRR
jgi:hypothetical protein